MTIKPGMNWQDLAATAPIDQLLADVRDSKPTEIAVVVRRGSGYVEVWGSHPNADAVIGLLMRGVHWLTEREQLTEQESYDSAMAREHGPDLDRER